MWRCFLVPHQGLQKVEQHTSMCSQMLSASFLLVFAETQDFNATIAQVVFQPDPDRCVVIPILNDLVLEGDETFTVQLSTNETDIVMLGINNASVTIIDEDSKLLVGWQ